MSIKFCSIGSKPSVDLRLQRHNKAHAGFVNNMIACLDRNPKRPMAAHAENVARRAELAASLGVQDHRIGSHRHILHCGIKCNRHMCRYCMRVVLHNLHMNVIRACMIGGYVERNGESAVKRLHARMERTNKRRRLWMRESRGCG